MKNVKYEDNPLGNFKSKNNSIKSKDFISLCKENRSEHDEQVEVVKYLERLGVAYTAIPNGGKRHKKTAVDLKREGVKAGYPDILIDEARKGYHGLRIEMKRRAKTLKSGKKSTSHTSVSEEQKKWIETLNKNGFLAVVCYGEDEAIEVINEYFKK